MDSGLYAAYSGLLARTQALDTAANNLANTGTNGFRAQRDTFCGVLASGFSYEQQAAGQAGSQVGQSVNGFGVLGASAMDLGQGAMVPTGNPLDLALSGQGFFAVQTAHGVRYTRDGSFLKSPAGQIQTQAGEPVLDAQMQPITVPSGTVSVSVDGTISVDAGVAGKLGVFNIAGNNLTMEGANRYVAAAGVTPTAGDAVVNESMMQVADNALGAVVTQVTSAISLAVTAGNGTASAQDVASIQAQVASIRDGVLALGNIRYQGQYLFARSQGSTTPFTLNTTTNPATASYNGDLAPQKIQTPDGQKVAMNVPGSSLFMSASWDLLGTLNKLVSDLSAVAAGGGSTATIQADSTALSTALGEVSSHRAGLLSSFSRLTTAGTYSASQEAVYQAQQSTLLFTLLSADPASVATELKAAEVQHQALLAVTSALAGAQDLFNYIH